MPKLEPSKGFGPSGLSNIVSEIVFVQGVGSPHGRCRIHGCAAVVAEAMLHLPDDDDAAPDLLSAAGADDERATQLCDVPPIETERS